MKTIAHHNITISKNKNTFALLLILLFGFSSCDDDSNSVISTQTLATFKFSHNWDGNPITETDFDTIQYTTENGDVLSIDRLRYIISDITFSGSSNEQLNFDTHYFIDVTDDNSDLSFNERLSFTTPSQIPSGTYNVSFTFGLDNAYNAQNLLDLNTVIFNIPEMLGGGYHYMQLDGKFINNTNQEQGFNYHAIRAVDNPGPNPTFPQDTFFRVNLGSVTVLPDTEIEIQMNVAEWFKNPIVWDLNEYNQMLMPNSEAQIMMFQNGQTVFSLGAVTQNSAD